jgi:hypothetical protein
MAELKFKAEGKVEPLLEVAAAQIRENRYYERCGGERRWVTLLALGLAAKAVTCRIVDPPEKSC